ncbi:MAG: helix-turn-helix domain-containing protein [Blastocatellia bacterium]
MTNESQPYNACVMAGGRPATKEAPAFGQRLAAVRKSKGWSQRELADKLGVKRELVDYYERRAPNPALDFIRRAAEALGVSAAELIGNEPARKKRGGGPEGRMRRLFEQASKLPRSQQEKIAAVLEAFIAQHKATP